MSSFIDMHMPRSHMPQCPVCQEAKVWGVCGCDRKPKELIIRGSRNRSKS